MKRWETDLYKLLVVDDESLIRRGIRDLIDFQSLGIDQCLEAENGENAIQLIKERQIHIILADINMPKMNGLELAKEAKKYDPAVKIALITGYDYLDYAISAIKIGVDDYVLKPVGRDDIQKVLFNLIEKRKADDRINAMKKAVTRITKNVVLEGDSDLKRMLADEMEKRIGDSSFSLNQMAFDLGYSVSYMSMIFKKLFGENFRDCLLNIRLERAKILLLSTQMKNYEISEAIGIDDPNYFSACFRRKYHITAKAFKNSLGAADEDN